MTSRLLEPALADPEARFRGAIPRIYREMSWTPAEGLAVPVLLKLAGLTSSTSESIR